MIKDKSIFIKNVYYMLAYAFNVLRQDEYADVEAEEFDNIHNLFAAILAKGIGRQLKQGLHREYSEKIEDLGTVRGKINMVGTVRNRIAHKRLVSCEHDELTEDNPMNRALKATALLLLGCDDVKGKYRDELKKTMLFFSDIDVVDVASIRWSSMRFTRSNQSYRMLMSVCQLVVEGMLVTTDSGERRLAKFVDEQRMSRLYEKFILEYYAQECDLADASSPQIKWALDDGIGTMLPTMQSDIVLSRDNHVLIIDAKYYTHATQRQFDVNTVHSNNLYQIFTYVKNKEAELADMPHEISGMLLYAKTDEEIQPDGVYQMSGNKVSVKTLDLNLPFAEIAAQLNDIAAAHFG